MDDDNKTATDGSAGDAAAEPAKEPEAETNDDNNDKPAEEASTEEPKADDTAAPAESAGTDQQGRTLYNVKCSNCGKDTQVPFQPSGDRPVYCRDCYMQKKNSQ